MYPLNFKYIKQRISLYKNVIYILFHQGFDILKYIYIYVPKHRNLFEPLKQFKDIHKGKRCFIVATGPSLTIDDINKLKGEICWSCNSGIKLFDKTDWRPDYYAIGDGTVFNRIKDELMNTELKCAFYNHKDIKWEGKNIFPLPVWVSLVIDNNTRNFFPKFLLKKRMSKDITKKVYMGDNITNIILQICFYMGFSEIYLLGCDCNYSMSNKLHSNLAGYKNENKLHDIPSNIESSMFADHLLALNEAQKRGIKIFNATRGGKLEVYERVDLDNVLK